MSDDMLLDIDEDDEEVYLEQIQKRARLQGAFEELTQFDEIPSDVRFQILLPLKPADLALFCNQSSEFALVYCGIGDPAALGIPDDEIFWEHWAYWLERDFGLSHEPNKCAANAPLERTLLARAMEQWLPLRIPEERRQTNLYRLRRLRTMYRALFTSTQSGIPLPPNTTPLAQKNGIVLYRGRSAQRPRYEGVYVTTVVTLIHNQLEPETVMPILTFAVVGFETFVRFATSDSQSGVYVLVSRSADVQATTTYVTVLIFGITRVFTATTTTLFDHDTPIFSSLNPATISVYFDPARPTSVYLKLMTRRPGMLWYHADIADRDALPMNQDSIVVTLTHTPVLGSVPRFSNPHEMLLTDTARFFPFSYKKFRIERTNSATVCFREPAEANLVGFRRAFVVPVLADASKTRVGRFRTRLIAFYQRSDVDAPETTGSFVTMVDIPDQTDVRPVALHYRLNGNANMFVLQEYAAIYNGNTFTAVVRFVEDGPAMFYALNVETGDLLLSPFTGMAGYGVSSPPALPGGDGPAYNAGTISSGSTVFVLANDFTNFDFGLARGALMTRVIRTRIPAQVERARKCA